MGVYQRWRHRVTSTERGQLKSKICYARFIGLICLTCSFSLLVFLVRYSMLQVTSTADVNFFSSQIGSQIDIVPIATHASLSSIISLATKNGVKQTNLDDQMKELGLVDELEAHERLAEFTDQSKVKAAHCSEAIDLVIQKQAEQQALHAPGSHKHRCIAACLLLS